MTDKPLTLESFKEALEEFKDAKLSIKPTHIIVDPSWIKEHKMNWSHSERVTVFLLGLGVVEIVAGLIFENTLFTICGLIFIVVAGGIVIRDA